MKKIFILSSFLCVGLATCQFHFEDDVFDVTLKGECSYENSQKNEAEKGQKGLFKDCFKDAEKEH